MNKAQELKSAARERTQDLRETLKGQAQTAREDLREKTQQIKNQAGTARVALKEQIRDERVKLQEKLKSEHENLKERLKGIRDEAKKNMVEKIDSSLLKLNERKTNQWTAALEKLESVLKRVLERAEKAKAGGKDITSVTSASGAASTAIAAAKDAVLAQSQKIYTLQITDEQGLKNAVRAAREILNSDLKAVQEKVKVARDAVHNTATTLAKLMPAEKLAADQPSPASAPAQPSGTQ